MTELLRRMQGTESRAYTKTHPWITFSLDMRKAPPRLWLMLGEARSKAQHLSGVPLKPDYAKQLHAVYLAKGVHATTAIEGNTLSEAQVLSRVQSDAQVVPESQEYLQTEIDNVIHVANHIIDQCEVDGQRPLRVAEIRDYNRSILANLECEDHVVPGEYRETSVGVMDYKAPDCVDCDYLVGRLCDWLNSEEFKSDVDDEVIVHGIIKAILAHVYLAWIHPFGDGNGRTARILEVRFLMESGVPAPAVHLLSNHYNRTRTEYYRRLQEASRNGGDLTNFMIYAVTGYVDQLRQQLSSVRAQQWGVAWQNYIYEVFGQEKTVADKRQIALLLALTPYDNPVPVSQLRRLSPELAEGYAGKTPKTISRDVNRLEDLGFVERMGKGVRARKEIILAFLPRMKRGGLDGYLADGKRMVSDANQFGSDSVSLIDDTIDA